MSEVIVSNIQLWRQKSADGSITLEEMRDAIAAIRKERVEKSITSDASTQRKATAKAKAVPIDSDDLLKELEL